MPSIIRFSRYDLIVIKFNGFVTNSHIDFVRNCLEKAADACLCLFSIYLPDFVCKIMMQLYITYIKPKLRDFNFILTDLYKPLIFEECVR